MSKSRSLSVYLLKEGVSFSDALCSKSQKDGMAKLQLVPDAKLPDGQQLYVVQYEETDPWWKSYLGLDLQIRQRMNGAILFVSASGRNFAFTFGLVSHYLDDRKYEHDFGLLTTLNTIKPDAVKSADVMRPENALKSRVQPARGASIDELDIDFNQAVMKKVTGSVSEDWNYLFSNISGASSAKISTRLQLASLGEVCSRLLDAYKCKNYETTFSSLRNIVPEHDPDVIDSLKLALVAAVKNKDETLIFSIPEITDYRNVEGIKFKPGKKYDMILMESLWDALQKKLENLTFEILECTKVVLVNADGNAAGKSFAVCRCLVWDCEKDGRHYHYCDGQWFCVNADFVARIQTELNPYFSSTALPPNCELHEKDYNDRAAKLTQGMTCLDMSDISLRKETQVEPCDLIRLVDRRIELTHVKIGVCSRVLSHLFFQGVNSAYLLVNEEQCRQKLLEEIRIRDANADIDRYEEALNRSELSVVYAIITKKNSVMKSSALPLFSRISLLHAIRRLKSMRIEVSVQFVPDNVTR